MSEIRVMPIILLDDLVVYPNCNYTISLEDEKDISAIKAAMGDDNYIAIANAEDFEKGIIENNIYRIVTVCKIKNAMRGLDSGVKLAVKGVERAYVDTITRNDEFSVCAIESVVEFNSEDEEKTSACLDILKDLFSKYRGVTPFIQPVLISEVKKCDDIGKLSDILADKIVSKMKSKRDILDETDVYERAVKLIGYIEAEIERANIKNEIAIKAKEKIDEAQKEFFLREELKVIQEELGDKSGVGEEIANYKKKMEELKLPSYAVEKLESEFKKLKRANSATPDSSMIRDYIENVLALPWSKMSVECKSLKKAEKILNKEHYGLEKVKERILEYLAVRMKVKNPNAPILCLFGPPGVGKTSIAKSVAKALGREYVRMSLGGISDEAEIRGHRRTYLGSMPGRIMNALKQAGTSNPLILLDEIDKLGRDYKGDPSAALLEVLDGEQNINFRDNYIEMPYDLSHCLFFCTANSLDTIPAPLRDRMEIVELSSYTTEEKYHIASDYLIPKHLEANGLEKGDLKFKKEAIYDIIEGYTREAGVRGLERNIGKVCRKALKQIMDEEKTSVNITSKNLSEYLGKRIFRPESINSENEVGICKGLAWTAVGGTTLDVEVNIIKGKGSYKITGNVGKVMEESYNAALSYIRANSEELGVDIDFDKTDVHIHIPEGATPKDGPSAGITMATAMISAMTKTPIRADVAMTGEISIRGKVMPIGGLKEKVLAAKRAGVKKVILPIDNAPDLEEIPEYGKEDIQFVLASKMSDVLTNSLVK